MRLAPLTFHAVPLAPKFSEMEQVIEAYCRGSAGLSSRECTALFACLVSMFFRWETYHELSLVKYAKDTDAAARLAFAGLFALRKMGNRESGAEVRQQFLLLQEIALSADAPCLLFQDFPDPYQDEDAVLCHVAGRVCRMDIMKMVDSSTP